ncbi:hypothetical protein [Ketobacter sp.]|uniref:hypothetical protein n=1 Tax=Ketobacter sp. TaxID=2083498 RepID=UPI000F0E1EEF|nr:hypothetical protein [Ketobacter sp.]RLU00981.1 MAG: hypothetical protein D9N14_04365 [Ketobacter sp.]
MPVPNTLFLIAKHGLEKGSEPGLLESWMWNLTSEDESMSYVSLHKSKSDRAYKGGCIVEIREVSDSEVEKHQELLESLGKDPMQDTGARKIIVFKVDPKWNKLWPRNAKYHQMAYKSTGYIEPVI